MKMPKAIGVADIVAGLIKDRSSDELKLLIFNFDGTKYDLRAKDPHLVVPIVTDPKKACFAMRWLVCEVERREKLQTAKKRPPDFEESAVRVNGNPTIRDNRVLPLVVAISGAERLPKDVREGLADDYERILRRTENVGITVLTLNGGCEAVGLIDA